MKSLSLVLPFMFLGIVQAGVAGPIYTWQDESGHVYYSDRPLAGEEQSEQVDLQTEVTSDGQAESAEQYSIREQIEYFDKKREQQRQAWLEERRLRQEERAQELEEQRLEYEKERAEDSDPGTVYVTPYRYRPIDRYERFNRPPGGRHYSPYGLQYQHTGDHHRFNLDIGNRYPTNTIPYRSRSNISTGKHGSYGRRCITDCGSGPGNRK